MDTKWKSSRSIRTFLAILVILAAVFCSFYTFPVIGERVEESFKGEETAEPEIDVGFMSDLEMGSQLLYYEKVGYTNLGTYDAQIREILADWSPYFHGRFDQVDYYMEAGETEERNTTRRLNALLEGADEETISSFQDAYQCYFVLAYDENGTLFVEHVWSMDGLEKEITEAFLNAARENSLSELLEQSDLYINRAELQKVGYGPKNFQVAIGIPRNINILENEGWGYDGYWAYMNRFAAEGSSILYAGTLAALLAAMLLLTSRHIWRGTIRYERRWKWYLMEAAVLAVILVPTAHDAFVNINVQYVELLDSRKLLEIIKSGDAEEILILAEMAVTVLVLYAGWYLGLLFLRPLFCLGLREYVRQYSIIYMLLSKFVGWCRRKWNRLMEEVNHIDFGKKGVKTIRKVVLLNFLVLSVLSFLWFFGIFALAIYSVILFFLIKRQYDRVAKNYQSLMHATAHIAQGELDYEDEADWGIFEPFKKELTKIRSGFGKAVENEVKSQRMKAELITNVSHDLKTPLTAITTYVELLKDPAITEEQRTAYIQILEKKSLRLKALVEDLFEVSKATSNTIQLELMEVDVVNLLKQVAVEHADKFEEQGLEMRWKTPEDRVVRLLDNQKTYRIFENLFVNIEKYAMPNSRVFVEVARLGADGEAEILVKNMSAQELDFDCTEITERFVRGDAARSTEGSGLGLAIAKSFTEAQKGTFEVMVDGDLFKVRIVL